MQVWGRGGGGGGESTERFLPEKEREGRLFLAQIMVATDIIFQNSLTFP